MVLRLWENFTSMFYGCTFKINECWDHVMNTLVINVCFNKALPLYKLRVATMWNYDPVIMMLVVFIDTTHRVCDILN